MTRIPFVENARQIKQLRAVKQHGPTLAQEAAASAASAVVAFVAHAAAEAGQHQQAAALLDCRERIAEECRHEIVRRLRAYGVHLSLEENWSPDVAVAFGAAPP